MNILETLANHQAWLNGADGGAQADLRNAYLRHANLRHANLRHANLRHANLRNAYLSDANLFSADLFSADLRGANLFNAYLRGANLFNADLRGANLRGVTGNMREIKTIHVETYPIAYTAEILQIGCERHEIAHWWVFDDKRILEMDGKTALKFWRKWKNVIKQIIELSPATHTRTQP